MQIPALTAIKASFVYFYRRIFNKGHERVFGYMTAIMLGLILIWGLGYFFSFVFICPRHPTAYWTSYIEQKQYCVDTVALHNAYGVSDATLDIIVILLPIPWVGPFWVKSRGAAEHLLMTATVDLAVADEHYAEIRNHRNIWLGRLVSERHLQS